MYLFTFIKIVLLCFTFSSYNRRLRDKKCLMIIKAWHTTFLNLKYHLIVTSLTFSLRLKPMPKIRPSCTISKIPLWVNGTISLRYEEMIFQPDEVIMLGGTPPGFRCLTISSYSIILFILVIPHWSMSLFHCSNCHTQNNCIPI